MGVEADELEIEEIEQIPYRQFSFSPEIIPAAFQGLQPTEFDIAARGGFQEKNGHRTMMIIPGFGASTRSFPVDAQLWSAQSPHTLLITHSAVNYKTSRDFLLWQYHSLLHRFGSISFDLFGISLGGSLGVQLLSHLRRFDPHLYAKCGKMATLFAPLQGEDLTLLWRRVLGICRTLMRDAQNQESSLQTNSIRELLLAGGLAKLARFISPADFEAETDEELIRVMIHAAQIFEGAEQAGLSENMFGDLPIAEISCARDNKISRASVAKLSQAGRNIQGPGSHTPKSYRQHLDDYSEILRGVIYK